MPELNEMFERKLSRLLMYGRRPLPATKCHRVLVAIELHQGAVDMQITAIGLISPRTCSKFMGST